MRSQRLRVTSWKYWDGEERMVHGRAVKCSVHEYETQGVYLQPLHNLLCFFKIISVLSDACRDLVMAARGRKMSWGRGRRGETQEFRRCGIYTDHLVKDINKR